MPKKLAVASVLLLMLVNLACDDSDPYDVTLCRPILEEACELSMECAESGYNFFTVSGSFSSSTMATLEMCVEGKQGLCDEENGINFGACKKKLDDIECAEDEDGDMGALLPEECKWLTGDLN